MVDRLDDKFEENIQAFNDFFETDEKSFSKKLYDYIMDKKLL